MASASSTYLEVWLASARSLVRCWHQCCWAHWDWECVTIKGLGCSTGEVGHYAVCMDLSMRILCQNGPLQWTPVTECTKKLREEYLMLRGNECITDMGFIKWSWFMFKLEWKVQGVLIRVSPGNGNNIKIEILQIFMHLVQTYTNVFMNLGCVT